MAAAVIGALRVVLGADTAAFESGLKGAQKHLGDFGGAITKAAVGIGIAMAGALIALGVSIKKTIDEADKLGKMSQSIGIPVDELSRLKYAADLSDVSIETLGKSVGILSKHMVAVAAGTEKHGSALAALKINVKNTDGTMKSSSDVMAEVADRFAGIKDGAAKTTLAMALFGKAGKDMIPLLNQGGEAFRNLMGEADELGIVLDKKTAVAAEAFNDNLKRVSKITDGVILKMTAELLPTLEHLSEMYLEVAKDGTVLSDSSEVIIYIFKGIISTGVQVAVALKRIGVEATALWDVFVALRDVSKTILLPKEEFYAASKKLGEAWDNFKNKGVETEQVFRSTANFVNDMWNDAVVTIGTTGRAIEESTKKQRDFNTSLLAGKNELDNFFKSTEKTIAGHKAEALTVGALAGAKERLKVVMQAEAVAKENDIKLTEAQRIKITELANAAQLAALQLSGRTLIEESLPAWQLYEKQVLNTKLALESVGASAQQHALAQKKLAESVGVAWDQTASSITGSFANTFKEFAKNNKSLGQASKAFAIVQATINTYTAATKALALYGPTPVGYLAMAAAIAAGFAQVANINAQKFASGGSFKVGGVGGTDSKLVQMALTPGEMVEVRKGGQDSGSTPVNVTINGDSVSRNQVRELFETLNSGMRDGYRLSLVP